MLNSKGSKKKQKHSNIAERINQHLGYYGTDGTQGLQLSSYAGGHDISITLKVFQFENLGDDYLKLIEKQLFENLTHIVVDTNTNVQ